MVDSSLRVMAFGSGSIGLFNIPRLMEKRLELEVEGDCRGSVNCTRNDWTRREKCPGCFSQLFWRMYLVSKGSGEVENCLPTMGEALGFIPTPQKQNRATTKL